MDWQNGERPPRNYFTIPHGRDVSKSSVTARNAIRRNAISGTIELCIKAVTEIHIGTGGFTEYDGRLVKDVVRTNGIPVIPGSSIKGPIRQIHEAVFQGGDPWQEEVKRGNVSHAQLSLSAALFGALGYQGRLAFEDAVPIPTDGDAEIVQICLSAQYEPRLSEGRRFYGKMPQEAQQEPRIPALAIPRGTILLTYLHFDEVTKMELGTILRCMGLADSFKVRDGFQVRLGGGKYDGFGLAKFSPGKFKLMSKTLDDGLIQYWHENDEETRAFCGQLLKASNPNDNEQNILATFRENMH